MMAIHCRLCGAISLDQSVFDFQMMINASSRYSLVSYKCMNRRQRLTCNECCGVCQLVTCEFSAMLIMLVRRDMWLF